MSLNSLNTSFALFSLVIKVSYKKTYIRIDLCMLGDSAISWQLRCKCSLVSGLVCGDSCFAEVTRDSLDAAAPLK